MEKICEDVWKISGDGNVYLIMEPKVIVVDCGDYCDRENLRAEIEEVIPVDKVEVVLLTHLHYDHTGGVGLFLNAEIYASDIEIRDYLKSPGDFFFGKVPDEVSEGLKRLKALPDEICGLRVVECVGHTRGSVAFLDEKRGLLFSGDTLFENGIGRSDFANSDEGGIGVSVLRLRKFLDGGYVLMSGHDY